MVDIGENYSLKDFIERYGFLTLNWPNDITRINVTNNHVTVYYNEMIFSSFPIISRHIDGLDTHVIHGKYYGYRSDANYSGFAKNITVNDCILKTKSTFHLGKKHRTDGPASKNWYPDGTIRLIEYSIDGKLHNEKGWARQIYHYNEQLKEELWCLNGNLHRIDGPALRVWDEKGQLIHEVWYLNNKMHCIDGPALRIWNEKGQLKEETWLLNNKIHREDGSALRIWDKKGNLIRQEWYYNGIEQDSIVTKRAL